MSDVPMKQGAERSQTLKPDFETDVSDAEFIAAEQFFRFLDAALNEVLMWRLFESLAEETQEVVPRETSFFGNLIQVQRMVVAVVDKITRATKPLKRLQI